MEIRESRIISVLRQLNTYLFDDMNGRQVRLSASLKGGTIFYEQGGRWPRTFRHLGSVQEDGRTIVRAGILA